MSNFTWSYSGISLFKQCPQKFYRTRILKDIKEEAQDHLIYGKAVHTAAEEYGRDGTPIPEKYKFIQPYVDTLMKTKGDKHYELKMAIRTGNNMIIIFIATSTGTYSGSGFNHFITNRTMTNTSS